MTRRLAQIAMAISMAAMPTLVSAQGYPIGGTTPSQRPAGAPTITTVNHDGAWYRHALTGVVPPYPASLRFLEDQGNWHTPFNRPGATGPYDIRGWYR